MVIIPKIPIGDFDCCNKIQIRPIFKLLPRLVFMTFISKKPIFSENHRARQAILALATFALAGDNI